METIAAPTKHVSVQRRFWPELVLLVGIVCVLLAYAIGGYVSGRLVLVGSLNAALFVGGLAIVAVWCFAVFLFARGMKMFGRGPDDDGEPIDDSFVDTMMILAGLIVQLLLVLGTLALTGIIAVITAITISDPHYDLDVPGTSTKFVATTQFLHHTSVSIYSGKGITLERVDVQTPLAASTKDFHDNHRVETDSAGHSFLIYLKEGGGEAHVRLR